MHYKKAPILEAVLEFTWASPRTLEELNTALALPAFEKFEDPKPRHVVNASVDLQAGAVSQETKHIGFEVVLRDGSELVFLEQSKLVFVQRAPYDRWEYFQQQALNILEPVADTLQISEFSRIGLRFVNRIDVPYTDAGKFDTNDYITIMIDGPRDDVGIIEEFQMRLVKPTSEEGIAYALTVATLPSPLPDHGGIFLDIDVFTRNPVPVMEKGLLEVLSIMHREKNDIFENCITNNSRNLFGGEE